MEYTNFFKSAATALIIAAISFAGCGGGRSSANITMTTAVEGDVLIWMAGSGKAIVDWGDESAPETVTLKPEENGKIDPSQEYRHTFSGATNRTITIDGQNITHLGCGALGLTTLDISNNTALTRLDCSHNQLDVEALNALLGTLPGKDPYRSLRRYVVSIINNPGTDDCDKKLADAKGWTIN